eukprot:350954-Chlamydomonas_euryale.AAC.5
MPARHTTHWSLATPVLHAATARASTCQGTRVARRALRRHAASHVVRAQLSGTAPSGTCGPSSVELTWT